MPVPSTPPPSDSIPEKSGGALYLIGAVVLVGGAVGLYMWKKPAPVAPQVAAPTVTAPAAPTMEAPAFAPPPPPKIEETPDAGADAGPAAPTKVSSATGGAGPCGGACTGDATPALRSALAGVAGGARGCYQRALQRSEVSGSMTVSVQIGASGQVCSASISNDSVHSNEVSQCVLGRFRSGSFPPPTGGCVTANIPISFTVKSSN